MPKNTPVRRRIMDVASRLFYEQGYNSTGINQVIDESNISKASLYHHFPAKTDLLDAYLQQADSTWWEQLEAFLAPLKGPREKLLGILDFRIQRQVRNNYGGCPFVKISAEIAAETKGVFTLVEEHKARVRVLIKKLVKELPGKPSPLGAEMLGDTLYFLMEGATVTVNFQKNKKALVEARAIAEKLIP